jgi:phenylpropionate dioxygenase-like ring-hydroxylating dioxygenase large terminal subunit
MDAQLLRNCWYLAQSGAYLARGQMVGKTLLGEPVVIGRRADNGVFCLRNICPHRGIPLSYGWLKDCTLQCCYHGWKFDTRDGACVEIPSIPPDDTSLPLSAIKVRSYPCREVQGNVWVFMPGEGYVEGQALPPVPQIPDFPEHARPQVSETMHFPCNVDHAVMGLMDPAHASYVHTSWWWRTRNLKLREVRKDYEPIEHGFRMVRYPLRQSAKPYKLFGKNVSTEISFRLPGVRIEHIQGDRHTAVSLTCCTPLNDHETEVHQFLYWTTPVLTLFKPVARILLHKFLKQDRDVVVMQEEGLQHKPPIMFINDTDTQAKWYFSLKREWEKSQQEKRPFNNPVKAKTLRWMS